MPSRMDKYNPTPKNNITRSQKNEQLYKELYTNKTYTEFTGLGKDNVIELNNQSNSSTKRRSDINKNVSIFQGEPAEKRTNIIGSYKKILEEEVPEKNYNVNDVLDLARKNRKIEDEEEKNRKIKSIEYSILSDLSQEKIKEYKNKKEKGITREEEENIEELVHTITSNSLRKKIDDELLNDLMPDEEHQTLISDELLNEIRKQEDDEIDLENTLETTLERTLGGELDKSFYTHSMDLKKEDLVFDENEEDDDELVDLFADDKSSKGKIIAIVILSLIVLGIIGFVVFKFL